jgi:ankyrin repeat protein
MKTARELFACCREGNVAEALRLLDSRASVNVTDESVERKTPLHMACRQSHLTLAVALLDRNAAVNQTDNRGWTALNYAASNGSKQIVELLLDHNGNVNTQTKNGNTPLHNAASKGFSDVAALLVDRGADIGIANVCMYVCVSNRVLTDNLLNRRNINPCGISSIRSKRCNTAQPWMFAINKCAKHSEFEVQRGTINNNSFAHAHLAE